MFGQRFNLVLDTGMFLLAVVLLGTGLLMAWVLPPGSRGATAWGLTRHEWGDVHLVVALVLTGLVLVHLATHWAWVCNASARLVGVAATRSRRRRAIAGAVTLLVTAGLLAYFLWAARVAPGAMAGHGWGLHRGGP